MVARAECRLPDVEDDRARRVAYVGAPAVGPEPVAVPRTLDAASDELGVDHEIAAVRTSGIGRHRFATPGSPEEHATVLRGD